MKPNPVSLAKDATSPYQYDTLSIEYLTLVATMRELRREKSLKHPLQIQGIEKSFGATRAIVEANLTIEPGTVHTLLGENGSGKSTLVKILGGVHRPDKGDLLFGSPLNLKSPTAARRNGIATVFQEVLTVSSQSIYQNVWLGSDGIFRTRGNTANRRRITQETLRELLGYDINIDVLAAEVSLSDRQAICIARALVTDPELLILDESTASLDIATRDRLFAIIRRLQSKGVGVLFISHRMDEIKEISDAVTVLRSGQTIETLERDEISPERLVELMTGTNSAAVTEREPVTPGAVVLTASKVQLSPEAEPFDLTIREGELIGLAGLEGHGQDQFIKRLAGLGSCTATIEVQTPDARMPLNWRSAAKLGVSYLPRERRGESLFPALSITENFAIPTIAQDKRGGLWSPRASKRRFKEFAKELKVRMANDDAPISTLSGGNAQKVLMARWLATEPRVLLLNDPTRGVDLGTKRELYKLLDDLCRQGMAIVMLSSEVDELIELVDRVLVFRDKAVGEVIERPDLTRKRLVSAYFGRAERIAA